MGASYTDTKANIYHSSCEETCPNSCTNNWQYYYNDVWKTDYSIDVSCGKDVFIILMEITFDKFRFAQ